MGILSPGLRWLTLLPACLLGCAIAVSAAAQTAPPGDVFSSGTNTESRGIIISITPNGINTYDVKLQDPVTHYIRSVTVEADVISGLKPGQRVTQYKDPDTGENLLAPTILVKPGQRVPGQTQESGVGSSPPPAIGEPGGFSPYQGGATNNGEVPSYPAPKMVGNLTGSGFVNDIPVEIGGGPNTIPVPADASPGTIITASNQTGVGSWKQFRGPLMSDGSGYYVQFNQGYIDGYYNNQYRRGWLPIRPQAVRLRAN